MAQAGDPHLAHLRILAEDRSLAHHQVGDAPGAHLARHLGDPQHARGVHRERSHQFVLGGAAVHGAARGLGEATHVLQPHGAGRGRHACMQQFREVRGRQRPMLQLAQRHRIHRAGRLHIGRAREVEGHHHRPRSGAHLGEPAVLAPASNDRGIELHLARQCVGAEQVAFVGCVEPHAFLAGRGGMQRGERVGQHRRLVAGRVRAPHFLALRMPCGVGERLSLESDGADERAGIRGAVPGVGAVVVAAGGLEGHAGAGVLPHRARGARLVAEQADLRASAENACIRVDCGGGEPERAEFLALVGAERGKVRGAHLRHHLGVPVRTVLAGGRTRGGGTVHTHARIDEARIDDTPRTVVDRGAGRQLERATRANALDPAILHHDDRIGEPLARRGHERHVHDGVAAHVHRPHRRGRCLLRPRGGFREHERNRAQRRGGQEGAEL